MKKKTIIMTAVLAALLILAVILGIAAFSCGFSDNKTSGERKTLCSIFVTSQLSVTAA